MIKNTILLISDEAMPIDSAEEVPSRLLSLFTSPVIRRDDIVYPDFVGEVGIIGNIGIFSRPIPDCTAFAFRADWQDTDAELEVAYVKRNDTLGTEISLIGMYSEHSSKYPYPINSIFNETFWEELPILTHETFRFYLENLGMYVTLFAIPDLAEKYNTIIDLSTAGYEEWCSIITSQYPSTIDEGVNESY